MSRTGASELEPLVNQYEHLSDKRRASEALERLRKIASMVKPVMRQRDWRVGTLAEFYPSEHNLLGLNVNKGQKICLRLRYPGDDTQFLPIENVVDTMLHELAHIVHGPHDQHFHALWDKLRDEHEALVRKGYTGEGFLGRGQQLGGRRVPMSEARRMARAAAEKRKDLYGSTAGGQRLGGSGIKRGQNARQVIAAAAEKRMKIERGCASATDKGNRIAHEEEIKKEKVTRTTVDHEDENEAMLMQAYIDLIQEEEMERLGNDYVPPSQENPAGNKGTAFPPGIRTSMFPEVSPSALFERQKEIEKNLKRNRENEHKTTVGPISKRQSPPPPNILARPSDVVPIVDSSASQQPRPNKPKDPEPIPPPETWTCEICTLVNPILFLTCDACSTERPEIYSQLVSSSSPTRAPLPQSNNSSSRNGTSQRETPNALKPRLNVVQSLAKIDQQAAYKQSQPVGWRCRCGNFMENQWWTCSVCGRMKESS